MLFTGDLFRMDEEGYFYFIGRKDDIVQAGGRKVSHREVRNVLHGMIEIAEAVVMGVPDPRLGQSIKAFVRVHGGAVVDEVDIVRYGRKYLEGYMVCPRRWTL